MARKAPQLCPCGKLAASGERCPCQRKRDAAAKARHDATRPSAVERGYDAEWRALRAAYLKANPICSEPNCRAKATDVDHIVSIRDRPDLRLVWRNLRAFCHPHHSRRTALEQGFARRRSP